ncbi:MAG: hypothetical protein H7Z16_13510 [Pyrinomonadaceae bacterium]|nr:hypothetical protein [Pyrinomonadaceae bacterium]
MDYYQSEAEIEAVVKGFESCTTAKEEFKHRNHLTVAVWYLSHSTPEEALHKMRSGLFRFLDHHGVGRAKYHETLTTFWIKLVQNALDQMDAQTSLVEIANAVLERLADPAVVFQYFSEGCLNSETAKKNWVEPDLKDL